MVTRRAVDMATGVEVACRLGWTRQGRVAGPNKTGPLSSLLRSVSSRLTTSAIHRRLVSRSPSSISVQRHTH